jgi:hypothetical protein
MGSKRLRQTDTIVSMLLKDVGSPESKFFLKSEWGPASDDWPAVSFSKRSVGRHMRAALAIARQ